jgi:hypothetical protein
MTDRNPSDAARELYIWLTTSCAAAMATAEHAFRNYERKRARGVYDAALARKGLAYAVEQAARDYVSEFCGPGEHWHAIFPPADRAAVADMVMTDTENEWAIGNFWSN